MFFEDLLEYSSVPEEYCDFAIEVLSDPVHYQTKNAGLFLYELYTSRDALSEDQAQRVLGTICRNYSDYENEELCLLASDFIVRIFDRETAIGAMENLSKAVKNTNQKAGLLVAVQAIAHGCGDPNALQRCGALTERLK